ncbi:hypothetical protein [uncultured Roseobacter sp.]|uniref:hypothetical protein n=1 Tax=uncultured Roseobacter sp. TaxID=114847 RepID=UPI0026126F79|nr:hypothetical protein [uncultured Roseobacter sp.]
MTGYESDNDKPDAPGHGPDHQPGGILEDVALSLERCASEVQDRAYAIAMHRDAGLIAQLITLAADLERLALRARRMHEQG